VAGVVHDPGLDGRGTDVDSDVELISHGDRRQGLIADG
jgi:hypothetical protein